MRINFSLPLCFFNNSCHCCYLLSSRPLLLTKCNFVRASSQSYRHVSLPVDAVTRQGNAHEGQSCVKHAHYSCLLWTGIKSLCFASGLERIRKQVVLQPHWLQPHMSCATHIRLPIGRERVTWVLFRTFGLRGKSLNVSCLGDQTSCTKPT